MPDLKMPDLNRVFIAGRLTRDPETRTLPSGVAVTKFAVASSKYYRKNDGSKGEETVFVDCEAWAKTAEYVAENVTKGCPVIVEGGLKSDEWETRDGQKRTKIMLRADRVQTLQWGEQKASPGHPAADNYKQTSYNATEEAGADEDLPF